MESQLRGPLIGIAALLVALATGCTHAPGPAAGGTIAQVNVVPEFLDAWSTVRSAPRPEQVARTREALLGTHPELFGPEVGAHSRSAVGMAELPFDIPVEIEGDVELVA